MTTPAVIIVGAGIVRGHNLRDPFPAASSVAVPLHIPALSPALRKRFSFAIWATVRRAYPSSSALSSTPGP